MKQQRKTLPITRKRLFISALMSLLIVGIFLVLEKKDVINLYTEEKKTAVDTARTTSTAPSAQPEFTGGSEREPGNSLNENRGDGSITDNKGVIEEGTDTSNPITSTSGEISVYGPRLDAAIESGAAVSGASSLAKVSYRLMDNVSGVIATGELDVINGKFSGKLNYKSTATKARLDVYGTESDGSEYSNISIDLRLE